MRNNTFTLCPASGGKLHTYILDDGEFSRQGIRRPAVIVCPGGGYAMVSKNEGEPVALKFTSSGYHAFVLEYSVTIQNPFPVALQELARAIALVRQHAGDWMIDPDRIALVGFSAGGNLALSAGILFAEPVMTDELGLTAEQVRPNRLLLGYPAVTLYPKREGIPPEILQKMQRGEMPDFQGPSIRQILLGKETCTQEEYESLNLLNKLHPQVAPAFVWGSFSDTLIPATDLLHLAESLHGMNVPCELHLFGNGPHGMSLADTTVKAPQELENMHLADWFAMALKWLDETC